MKIPNNVNFFFFSTGIYCYSTESSKSQNLGFVSKKISSLCDSKQISKVNSFILFLLSCDLLTFFLTETS